MQNQPTTQPFTPQAALPPSQGQPYQVQPVFQAIPVVPRSNNDATAALVLGIISLVATFIVVLVIANYSYTEDGFLPVAIVSFLAGSFLALPSMASGKAGLSRSPSDGGALKASTGLVFGYFFYLSYFAVLLLHLFKAN